MGSVDRPRSDASEVTPATEKTDNSLQSYLAAIVESSSDAIIGKTLDGIVTLWNAAAERIFGIPAEEIIGKSITLTIPPERLTEENAILSRIRAGETVPHHYTLRLKKDGTLIHVAVTVSPIRDAGHAVIGASTIVRDITVERRAQDALTVIQSRYRQIVETSNEGIWTVDREGRIDFVNRRLCEMFGYEEREMLGKPFMDFMDDEARLHAEALFARRKQGVGEQAEIRYRRKDGSPLWAIIAATPFKDDRGEFNGALAMVTDIGDRKRAEEEISETSRRLALVVEALAELATSSGTRAELLELAAAKCRIISSADGAVIALIEGEELVCHAVSGISSQERGLRVRLDASLEGQALREARTIVLHDIEASPDAAPPAGSRAGLRSMVIVPLRTEDGPIGVVTALSARPHAFEPQAVSNVQLLAESIGALLQRRDATERNREQRSLLDRARDAILVSDLDHVVQYWNKSAERLYGWTAEEAIGQPLTSLIYKDRTRFDDAMQRLLEHGEWLGELMHVSRTGEPMTVEARWTLLRDETGEPATVLAIGTDITERKSLEQQFLRAQRLESLGTLAGGIAHDLNNVLAPIMLSLELLRDDVQTDDGRELIDTVAASAQRGAHMVQQVLSFARGMNGQRVEVQVGQLLRDVEKIVRDTFVKNIIVRSTTTQDLWPVLGDATQLHQVLLNLCVNARDAMPDGGEIRLSARNVQIDEHYVAMNIDAKIGPHVVIRVEDTGTGIPPAIIDMIFDPFFTTKELGKGTGLGLSTSLAIVKSHKGFVHVYSEPGCGTMFNLYLPAETQLAATGGAAPAQERVMPRGSGELVLVVDDEPSIRRITQQTLEAFGYRVLVAADGAEGVAVYAQNHSEIDVVITDMMMPVMDGNAAIIALMTIDPSVRIVAASGVMAGERAARASAAGVKHFLSKPYTADTLLAVLRDVLADAETKPLP